MGTRSSSAQVSGTSLFPTCPKPRLVSHLRKSSFPSRYSAGVWWSEAPVSIAAGCHSPWMRSSSPFKECQCATFCREEIHVNLPFVPLPPKVAVSRDHSYTSAALKNRGCSLHRLCIFCSFFPLKAAYQNLLVVFLSSYPKNTIQKGAVNTTI